MKENLDSVILSATSRLITPVMLLFSIYLLARGHYLPGGGFIGGLTAGAALVFHAFAGSTARTERVFRLDPLTWIAAGLLLALGSGLWGLAFGEAFLEGHWLPWEIPVLPKLGTPFFFDIGVYVVVIGCTVLIAFKVMK